MTLKELMKNQAESLNKYKMFIEKYLIISGISKEEYDKSIKVLNKTIKRLNKGNLKNAKKVYNKERFIESIKDEYPEIINELSEW